MISRNKPLQNIYQTLYPQATRHQIPSYKDQNNYSFSTKHNHLLEQQINTSRINGDTMKNRRRNSQFTLKSKEQNIKSIDQKIEAILKKHAEQKEVLQDLKIINQQPKQISTKFTKNQRSINILNYQVPKVQHSQNLFNRPYDSEKKQIKYETNKKENENPLNQKIKMLNQRIKKTQQQKKKLNLNFKPFVFVGVFQSQQKQFNQLTTLDQKIKQLTVKNECIVNSNILKAIKQSKNPSLQGQTEHLGKIKHQKPSFKEVKNGPQNKKLSIQSSLLQNQKAIEQLLEALIEQIKLDQTLRNLKIWFTFYKQASKWETLKQKLAKKKQYTIKQLKTIFQSNIEEHNPFFKWDSIDFSKGLQDLIKAYETSSLYWEKSILKRWKRSTFESLSLRQKIQIERNCQVIVLQDLVRFINLQKDSFFRNRDLYLIYTRLCEKNHKLSYQRFVNAITKRQQQ